MLRYAIEQAGTARRQAAIGTGGEEARILIRPQESERICPHAEEAFRSVLLLSACCLPLPSFLLPISPSLLPACLCLLPCPCHDMVR